MIFTFFSTKFIGRGIKNNFNLYSSISVRPSFIQSNRISPRMAQSSVIVSNHAPRETINPAKRRIEASNKLLKSASHRKKCEELLAALTKTLKESDLKVIAFIAACNKNVVKPFPFHLADESFEGSQYLDSINKRILKLEILRHYLQNSKRYKVEEPVIELLHWLICGLQKKQRLQSMSDSLSVLEAVLRLVQANSDMALPTVCFKIQYFAQSWENLQWEELSSNKTTKFAFLKTEIDQLHSLIHLGAGCHVNSYGNVGSGVLLTDNLSVCLDATLASWVWGKSSLGLQMKSVALVEFIDDQAIALDSEDNKGTYYLVNTAAAIRPRFVLIYKREPALAVQPPDVTSIEENIVYRFLDRLLNHLPCIIAYAGLTYFLVRESKSWRSWGANGARAAVVTLVSRLSSTDQTK